MVTELPIQPSDGPRGGSAPEELNALEDMRIWERQEFDVLRYQGGLRFGTALSILQTTERIYGQLERLQCPVLLLGGEDDPTCDPAAVRELYQRAGSTDKTIKQYPGMGHIIMFTEQTEKSADVEQQMKTWLMARNVGAATGWRYATPPAPRRAWLAERRWSQAVGAVGLGLLVGVLAWWLRKRRLSALL